MSPGVHWTGAFTHYCLWHWLLCILSTTWLSCGLGLYLKSKYWPKKRRWRFIQRILWPILSPSTRYFIDDIIHGRSATMLFYKDNNGDSDVHILLSVKTGHLCRNGFQSDIAVYINITWLLKTVQGLWRACTITLWTCVRIHLDNAKSVKAWAL